MAATQLRPNAAATLGALTTYYSNSAYLDLGAARAFTGDGLSVGLLVSSTASAACAPTAPANASLGAPSSTAYVEIGPYSAYSVVTACAAGNNAATGLPNAATYVTAPSAAPAVKTP